MNMNHIHLTIIPLQNLEIHNSAPVQYQVQYQDVTKDVQYQDVTNDSSCLQKNKIKVCKATRVFEFEL